MIFILVPKKSKILTIFILFNLNFHFGQTRPDNIKRPMPNNVKRLQWRQKKNNCACDLSFAGSCVWGCLCQSVHLNELTVCALIELCFACFALTLLLFSRFAVLPLQPPVFLNNFAILCTLLCIAMSNCCGVKLKKVPWPTTNGEKLTQPIYCMSFASWFLGSPISEIRKYTNSKIQIGVKDWRGVWLVTNMSLTPIKAGGLSLKNTNTAQL